MNVVYGPAKIDPEVIYLSKPPLEVRGVELDGLADAARLAASLGAVADIGNQLAQTFGSETTHRSNFMLLTITDDAQALSLQAQLLADIEQFTTVDAPFSFRAVDHYAGSILVKAVAASTPENLHRVTHRSGGGGGFGQQMFRRPRELDEDETADELGKFKKKDSNLIKNSLLDKTKITTFKNVEPKKYFK